MAKKDEMKKSKVPEQRNKPRESEMAEKDGGQSADDRLYDSVGLSDVKHCVDLLEDLIGEMMKDNKRKKDQDTDHPEPSYLLETELVLKLEEELNILKSKMKICEKEQHEKSNRQNKEMHGIEQELVNLVLRLEISSKCVAQRLSDMDKYKEKLEMITQEGERLRKRQRKTKTGKIENQDEEWTEFRISKHASVVSYYLAHCEVANAHAGLGTELNLLETELSWLRTRARQVARDGEIKSLADLDVPMKELKIRVEKHKKNVEALRCRINKLTELFRNLGVESVVKFEEDYEKTLRNIICIQKKEVNEGKSDNSKCLREIVQCLDESRRADSKALAGLRIAVIACGIDLSLLLLKYLLLFAKTEPKEMLDSEIEDVKNTIQSSSMEEGSVIVDTFVSVLEYIGTEMRNMNLTPEVVEDKELRKRGKDILNVVLIEIIKLETAFSRRIFLELYQNTDVLAEIARDLRKSFLWRTKTKYKMEFAGVRGAAQERFEKGIKEIWFKLNLRDEIIV